MPPIPAAQVLTANRLGDGRVVFRTPAGAWSLDIGESETVDGKPEGAALAALGKADEAAEIVVDTYLVDVDISGPSPRPTKLREAIRALGPTVPFGEAAIPIRSGAAR